MDELYNLASEIDQLVHDADPYEYMDTVFDQEANVKQIVSEIYDGNVEEIIEFLQDTAEGETSEAQKAKELIIRLADFENIKL